MHAFSEVLTAPPSVEILHVDDSGPEAAEASIERRMQTRANVGYDHAKRRR